MTKNFSLKGVLSLVLIVLFVSVSSLSAQTLSRQLSIGARGSDVSTLQTFLATNPAIYPQGLVTGYFGFLTKAAVSNFQSANGLTADGIAGRNTIAVIQGQMTSGMVSNAIAPIISGVSVSPMQTSATVTWSTQQSAKGVVYYSTTPFYLTDSINSVDVGGMVATNDGGYRNTQSVTIQGLRPNTIYYYLVYATSNAGIVSISWPTTFQTGN